MIYIFDNDFFNSRNSCQPKKTKKSYCVHNYAGTWVSKGMDLKSRIKRVIPKVILNLYFQIEQYLNLNLFLYHIFDIHILYQSYFLFL